MNSLRIDNGRLSARLIPFGATLVDLRLAGWDHPLVLGFERLEDYTQTSHYAGAVIGRHANRIYRGEVELEGRAVQLTRNSEGNHLHGGETGTARQTWMVTSRDRQSLQFEYTSPDGHEGYPGECRMVARYEIVEPGTLRLTLEARTDRATILNLCQHPYFNLNGDPTIARHVLEVAADRYLPSDQYLIPTGELRPVAGSPFDFTRPREVGRDAPCPGYNNTFCLADHTVNQPRRAARLTATGGPTMELWTTQPGLHLYDGYKLMPAVTGLDGRIYGPKAGICLEAQNWPDSPRNPLFPTSVLTPGKTYRQVTEYRFA